MIRFSTSCPFFALRWAKIYIMMLMLSLVLGQSGEDCGSTNASFCIHWLKHYNDVKTKAMGSHIINLTIAYSTVFSGADQRKYKSSAWLALLRGFHRWPVNSPHKTRKMFPIDYVIMVWNIPSGYFMLASIVLHQNKLLSPAVSEEFCKLASSLINRWIDVSCMAAAPQGYMDAVIKGVMCG